MVHSTRSALGMGVSGLAAVMKGGASVSLFVEAFGYVRERDDIVKAEQEGLHF